MGPRSRLLDRPAPRRARGALLLRGSLGDVADVGTTQPAGSQGEAFLWELVLTFFLLFVITAVATGSLQGLPLGAAVAVGGTIAMASLVGGPISGASLNPARSLAPALVSGNLHALWIYLVAPLVGGALGAFAYEFLTEELALDRGAPARLPSRARRRLEIRQLDETAPAALEHPRAALLARKLAVEEALNDLAVRAHERGVRKLGEQSHRVPPRRVRRQRLPALDLEAQALRERRDRLEAPRMRARHDPVDLVGRERRREPLRHRTPRSIEPARTVLCRQRKPLTRARMSQ